VGQTNKAGPGEITGACFAFDRFYAGPMRDRNNGLDFL